jgi:transcriptional regulator with AAA-type ATPase domain
MAVLSDSERVLATTLAKLTYCNPFLPERIQYEREALGEEFVEAGAVWNASASLEWERANIPRVQQRVEKLVEMVWGRLSEGQAATQQELDLYQDNVLYLLYHRTREISNEIIRDGEAKTGKRVTAYRQFEGDYWRYLSIPGVKIESRYSPHHMFASFFQVRRAFHHIFQNIIGRSMPAARLRAAVWQSIFTNDLERYERVLWDRMSDFMTLIVGPSGTGKELVARAIALSRYIPFDPKALAFTEDFKGLFSALNLSALSPTLIESELFGHRRGAFTGALEDRTGWLEACRGLGTVFLDEVGEIDGAIQVKLLRVLQTRTFQRLGDTASRRFEGKIIAATNRDLAKEMQAGRIRADFYYRLCSDMIVTPSLREILQDSPQELRNLIMFIAANLTEPRGETRADGRYEKEAEALTEEVEKWIGKHLGREYPWPGNFRELEQCMRNVLIRGEYWPAQMPGKGARQGLAEAVMNGSLTAEELLRRYVTLVQAQTHNYEETARRLGLDRRTVKAKVDPGMLEEMGRG